MWFSYLHYMRPSHPQPPGPCKKKIVIKEGESEGFFFIITHSQNKIILKFLTYQEKFPKVFNKENLN